jgi:hypothetical protein
MEKIMLTKKVIVAVAAMALLATGTAWAKVSPAEAEKLKGELTPMGAERAGNAEGTIPAWTGGITTPPADYKGPGTMRPDPFKDDKVLFEINAANIAKYEDKLTKGVAAFLKKNPSKSLSVYQSRRTASAPQVIYDRTFDNATKLDLTADKQGINYEGARAGVPFPIPQNGAEAVFNHLTRWRGVGMEGQIRQGTVQASGKVSWGGAKYIEQYGWNYTDRDFDGDYYKIFVTYGPKPARRKGEIAVVIDPLGSEPRKAWQYLPGQRRVRRAPAISFDTPNPSGSGITTYDDVFVYNGSLERYDWKLVGKKEIYLPYNSYAYDLASSEEIFNPIMAGETVDRWELHRYWVVEATLKDGKRHTYAKRTLYIDEDSWSCNATDSYDSKGNLWRFIYSFPVNTYEVPALNQGGYVSHDLTRDDYALIVLNDGKGKTTVFDSTVGNSYFSAENARRVGRR